MKLLQVSAPYMFTHTHMLPNPRISGSIEPEPGSEVEYRCMPRAR